MFRLIALLALATTPLAPPASHAQTATAEQRMPHISIVALGEAKPGREPVYLIPGLSSPRDVWDGIAPDLAKDQQVLLVQVNGFGGDALGENGKPGMTDGIIADLLADAAKRGAKRPAMIGHSYGGLIGMMLAARHPDRVGRLLVVDTLPFFGKLFDPAATPASIAPRAEQLRAMTIAGADRMRAMPTVTSDPGGIWSNTPEGRIKVANWGLKADQRAVAQALYEDIVTDIGPELGKVTAKPFTILYAAGVGEARAKAMWEPAYAGTPARLVAVPDSYHFIMLDQPQRFAAEVKAFLAE
ncbi:pimeloyl-ACP methyl ester carboxylesterase [Sphingomonas sp. BE123]|uniref:alpha/beta fold hydrolase n=1 Tax=Sphingomonas sp. BE123 TaxID=2817842 RepID=UPI00285A9DDD|nr:alpha/beta hydrolase [Sphingomonas sp. BE123]MDR6852789.1 pimeloyl-ACP methyl ester carboxylesterase [Sphingomonas sp. BE123]